MSGNLTKTFEMNGKAYTTDAQTLELLRTKAVPAAKAGNDKMLSYVMTIGLGTGRIVLVS